MNGLQINCFYTNEKLMIKHSIIDELHINSVSLTQWMSCNVRCHNYTKTFHNTQTADAPKRISSLTFQKQKETPQYFTKNQ